MIGIYKITSPSNKVYIGQSIDVENRLKRYKYFVSKKQTRLYYSILKYGYDNHTYEVLDDGGAYGDSGNYLFWFDTQGNYHQYYPSGGTYLEICDRPLRVKKTNFSITLN